MRIAIDARELAGKPTGVGRYLAEILRAWGELPGAAAHEFVLCAPDAIETGAITGIGDRGAGINGGSDGDERSGTRDSALGALAGGGIRVTTQVGPGHGVLWEQWVLPRLVAQTKADVLFAPAYSGPVHGATPMVVTIHDVSFAAHPEWFSWREGLRRRTLTRLSARRAAKVITVSDFSKREIVRHLGVDPSTVEVIYSGATSFDRRMGHDATGRRARARAAAGEDTAAPSSQSSDGGLVLYVGSLFNRRHIPALIDGFGRMARRHPPAQLEIVGDNRTRPHIDVESLIARSGSADRIRARAYVADEVLSALYGSAAAFAFLSDYEGFGLTPLEALAAGVPIVVLDTEVAREIYGPAAIYVERPDPALIDAALERVLFDEAERTRLFDAATRQLQRYSWRECAQRTLQVLLACG